jgi:DNA-binding NarL/FixJ family response regulator
MKTRIAIAEDNAFLLQSIKEKLAFFDDLDLRFTAVNGAEMIGKVEANSNIDVILMDIQMPEMDGIKATEILKNRFPQIKIIMLTVLDDDQYIFKSIIHGADGYLLKETPAHDLHRSLLEIMDGGAPMSPTIAMRALKMLRNPMPKEMSSSEEVSLTKRETEILESLSKGLEYKQIAENLFIASGTVRKHVENIYRKLNVRNKMEAVQKAMKRGIL